jgi:uracil-DNA glycosylase
MNDIASISNISELNELIESFTLQHYPESELKPIIGGGKCNKPEVMFVFINPTKRNCASDPTWTGPRVPWVGISTIWKVFAEAGIISPNLLQRILEAKSGSKTKWSPEFTDQVYNTLEQTGIYITNIVKWAGEDAALPEKQKIDRYIPLLKKEIELVRPRHVVCFGMIPFTGLTQMKPKILDVYTQTNAQNSLVFETLTIGDHTCTVSLCYFPVGMGRFHQKEAVELLRYTKDYLELEY